MKKIVASAFALGFGLLLTSCSSIHSGTITNKVYSPAYDMVRMQCLSYDSKGFCSMQMPITDHYSETFRFDLKSNDKTGWTYVTKEDFNSHNVGDYWG